MMEVEWEINEKIKKIITFIENIVFSLYRENIKGKRNNKDNEVLQDESINFVELLNGNKQDKKKKNKGVKLIPKIWAPM